MKKHLQQKRTLKGQSDLSLAELMYNLGEAIQQNSLDVLVYLKEETDHGGSSNLSTPVQNHPSSLMFSSTFSNKFAQMGIDRIDIAIISILWSRLIDGGGHFETSELLKKVYRNPVHAYLALDRIRELISKGLIVENEEEGRNNLFILLVKTEKDDSLNSFNIKLSEDIVGFITGKVKSFKIYQKTPFLTNYEHIAAWVNLWKAVYTLYLNSKSKLADDPSWSYQNHPLVGGLLSIMEQKEQISKIRLDFMKFRNKYGLSFYDTLLLSMILHHSSDTAIDTQQKIKNGILENHYRMHKNDIDNIYNSRLMKYDIVRIATYSPDEERYSNFKQLVFSPWVKPDNWGTSTDKSRNQKKQDEAIEIDIQKELPFFDLYTSRHSFKELIVNPELLSALKQVVSLKQEKTQNLLAEWGVKGYQARHHRGYSILLHGPSGTGKTLAAEVIASEMGKQILKADCNSILSKMFSESEKNAKTIFEKYYWLCQKTQNPPVLFFNEADQILTTRDQQLSGSDKTWNAVQNLILEALEKPYGLIIATTNLLKNFDDAYSRRFDLILEFPRPGYEERVKIWQTRLPQKLPGVEKLNVKELATYDLSGGQISKIIRNAALYLAGLPKVTCITNEILIKYCRDETDSSFETNIKIPKNVGFRSNKRTKNR